MRIAIVKLSALGDIIHAMIVLQFIINKYPDASIDWIVDDNFKGVLEHHPHIHQIISLKIKTYKQHKNYKKLWQEVKQVKYLKRYDILIDMQGLIKSAIITKLIPSDVKIGFDKHSIREKLASYFYTRTINIAYSENTIVRNLLVALQTLQIDFNSQLIENKQPFLFYKKKLNYQNYVVFVINSTWESKNYSVEKFIQVAHALQQTVYVLWVSKEEKQKAQYMSTQSKYIEVAPRLSLDELKAFIAGAKLVIGNDTGPTHMAWALNVASITLFGPTPENQIYPTNINKSLKSSSPINHYKLDKNDFSISEISVGSIVTLAKELLQNE